MQIRLMRSGPDVQVTALVMEIHPPAMLFRGSVLHTAVDIEICRRRCRQRRERKMPRSDNARPTNTHKQCAGSLRSAPRIPSGSSFLFFSLSLFLWAIFSLRRRGSFLPRIAGVAEKRVIKPLRRRHGVESGSSRRLGQTDKSRGYTSIPRRYESNGSGEMSALHICKFNRVRACYEIYFFYLTNKRLRSSRTDI